MPLCLANDQHTGLNSQDKWFHRSHEAWDASALYTLCSERPSVTFKLWIPHFYWFAVNYFFWVSPLYCIKNVSFAFVWLPGLQLFSGCKVRFKVTLFKGLSRRGLLITLNWVSQFFAQLKVSQLEYNGKVVDQRPWLVIFCNVQQTVHTWSEKHWCQLFSYAKPLWEAQWEIELFVGQPRLWKGDSGVVNQTPFSVICQQRLWNSRLELDRSHPK